MTSYRTESLQETIIAAHFKKMSVNPADFQYCCLIDKKKCKPQNGKYKSNLIKHVKTVHRDLYETKYGALSSSSNLARLRLEYIQHCTELVTVNSEPFSLLTKSGFLKMNHDKLERLNRGGYGSGLATSNCSAVKGHIDYLATEIIERIKSEVNGKFVSLLIDGATKYKRSILGIYIQYMLDSHVAVRSIGMVNLTSKHTGENLANIVRERLASVGIKTSRVVAITTDNGSNMRAMIKRLNDDEEDVESTEIDTAANAEIESNVENLKIGTESTEFVFSATRDYEAEFQEMTKSLAIANLINDNEHGPSGAIEAEEDSDTSEIERNIKSILEEITRIIDAKTWDILDIRCAAHTLQLAVMLALKTGDFEVLIQLCREVCKELRKNSVRIEMEENGILFKMPRIDVVTRWNSTHVMVSDLITYCLEAIKFLAKKEKTQAIFEMFLYKLQEIKELSSALKIPYDVTVEMQAKSFSLSDFYGTWLAVERRLKNLISDTSRCTDFAETLLQKIDMRGPSLLNTEAMLCAVYLDKRFEFKLTPCERNIAKASLTKLFHRVQAEKLQHSSIVTVAPSSGNESDSFEAEVQADGIAISSSAAAVDAINFEECLLAYDDIDRQHNKKSLLEFWEQIKSAHPEVYEVASIVHSIPPTQSTVERSFSILGYILSCRRTNLSPELLEKILLINLNRDLAEEINQRDLSRDR